MSNYILPDDVFLILLAIDLGDQVQGVFTSRSNAEWHLGYHYRQERERLELCGFKMPDFDTWKQSYRIVKFTLNALDNGEGE